MQDTWRVTFEILQWHSCVMLHDKHMDRCHAEGLLCLNKGINDACFLTSTLPTGTLRSVSIQLISSIFPCYYSDSPQQMIIRFESVQKYLQAAVRGMDGVRLLATPPDRHKSRQSFHPGTGFGSGQIFQILPFVFQALKWSCNAVE